MVFVHARKETVKTAERLKEMAQMEGNPEDFFRREVGLSRNKEMKQLFDYGFGIHHAGMLRSDRNMMERMFEANCIKVSLETWHPVDYKLIIISVPGLVLYIHLGVGSELACSCGCHQGHPSVRCREG
jgi:hypothetical protein